jgi:hypothetical protein
MLALVRLHKTARVDDTTNRSAGGEHLLSVIDVVADREKHQVVISDRLLCMWLS